MVDAERLLSLLGRVTSRLVVLDGYATQDRVDDGRVVDHLTHLPSLRAFVAAMTHLLDC